MGVGGSEAILVSNIGIASGSERRVIQKANGDASWLNTRSDDPVNGSVGAGGRSITDSGIVNCWFAVS